ncbi:MAG: DegT/DnrJ/EryC1/StrS aminotransferase family protein [Fimbriimonadaceae bacterium]|nr:DegT/DnrJ/EryC1/StrS aminotransferase family protein [Fimbriimonadaceae bacterium]
MIHASPEKLRFAPWPDFDDEQVAAVAEVLRTGRVNYHTGERGKAFEREFAEWAGSKRAIALANGSVAIELCLIGLGIQPGDEIVTSPRTFLATATSCWLQGVRPVFADVDPDSGNVTAETLAAAITPKTKALLPVHIGGWPCEMDAILDLAGAEGLKVIEDCAQAHGATYRGRSVGTFGQANAWSFCQDKIMTTGGEGGMVTTDDEEAWRRMWSFKDHGKDYDRMYHAKHPPGYRWLHESVGTNWRLTEMQSELGRIQLRRMPAWRTQRWANASVLIERLSRWSCLRVPVPPKHVEHAAYRYYFYVRNEALRDGWDRDRILVEAEARGVPIFSGSCGEIYREGALRSAGLTPAEPLPVARRIWGEALTVLTHPTLSTEDMHRMADALDPILAQAQR